MTDTINLQDEVASAMPALLSQLREQLKDRMGAEAQAVAMREVNAAVTQWAKDVLVPEVRAQLEAGKDGYIVAAQEIAEGLGRALGEAIIDNAKANLKHSWNIRKIAEALFQ